jgi:hypothetical protein
MNINSAGDEISAGDRVIGIKCQGTVKDLSDGIAWVEDAAGTVFEERCRFLVILPDDVLLE